MVGEFPELPSQESEAEMLRMSWSNFRSNISSILLDSSGQHSQKSSASMGRRYRPHHLMEVMSCHSVGPWGFWNSVSIFGKYSLPHQGRGEKLLLLPEHSTFSGTALMHSFS